MCCASKLEIEYLHSFTNGFYNLGGGCCCRQGFSFLLIYGFKYTNSIVICTRSIYMEYRLQTCRYWSLSEQRNALIFGSCQTRPAVKPQGRMPQRSQSFFTSCCHNIRPRNFGRARNHRRSGSRLDVDGGKPNSERLNKLEKRKTIWKQ